MRNNDVGEVRAMQDEDETVENGSSNVDVDTTDAWTTNHGKNNIARRGSRSEGRSAGADKAEAQDGDAEVRDDEAGGSDEDDMIMTSYELMIKDTYRQAAEKA